MCNLGHRVVKLIEMLMIHLHRDADDVENTFTVLEEACCALCDIVLMIHLHQDADDVVNTFAVLKEGCCALCDAAGLKLRIHSH